MIKEDEAGQNLAQRLDSKNRVGSEDNNLSEPYRQLC